MNAQTLSAIAGSFSAFFAMLSAAANWYNTRSFVRQLTNSSLDACVFGIIALEGAVYKTIEHKERAVKKIENIDQALLNSLLEEAWAKWITFTQAFYVTQGYNPKFNERDAPDELSILLNDLRISLRDPNWLPGGESDKRDIRAPVTNIKNWVRGLANQIRKK